MTWELTERSGQEPIDGIVPTSVHRKVAWPPHAPRVLTYAQDASENFKVVGEPLNTPGGGDAPIVTGYASLLLCCMRYDRPDTGLFFLLNKFWSYVNARDGTVPARLFVSKLMKELKFHSPTTLARSLRQDPARMRQDFGPVGGLAATRQQMSGRQGNQVTIARIRDLVRAASLDHRDLLPKRSRSECLRPTRTGVYHLDLDRLELNGRIVSRLRERTNNRRGLRVTDIALLAEAACEEGESLWRRHSDFERRCMVHAIERFNYPAATVRCDKFASSNAASDVIFRSFALTVVRPTH